MDFKKIYMKFNELTGTDKEFQVYSRLYSTDKFLPIDKNGNPSKESLVFTSKKQAEEFLIQMRKDFPRREFVINNAKWNGE